MRREFFNGESEISVARIIDRSVRPLFAKGFLNETQIVASLLSYEGGGDERVRRRRCLTWCGSVWCVRAYVRTCVCLSNVFGLHSRSGHRSNAWVTLYYYMCELHVATHPPTTSTYDGVV